MSKTTAPENASAQAAMLLDRLVSSSSAEDAAESLQGLLNGYSAESGEWEANWILNDDVLVEKMIELMHTGKINNIECDDSVASVIKLFQQLAKRGHTQQLLQAPIPGRLLESLLDVMGTSEQPVYIRVLSLQLLKSLSQHKSAQSQWLQAPNGLHRLGDLLEETEEVVRNEALLVAHDLSKHAPIAKVWIFAEVECKLLDACWTEGGLTRGNPIVLDALKLIHQLLQHADSALQDLVWQRPSLAPRLAQLLDLRGGTQFLNPETTQPTKSKNRKAQEDDDDDLDSLLQSGDVKNKNKLPETPPEPVVPQLTDKEEEIVHQVLEILRLLVQSEPVRHSVWKRHAPLVSLVWELALVNPANPPVCAMPSASLQQAALELVSQYFNHPETMDRHAGLDRLLFLVCTGGGTADNYAQQLGISQAALHVLRTTLTGDSIHQVLLHTLAPPPQEDENAPPPGPTVVEKLWNTVAENLAPPAADSGVDVDKDKRKIFLSGALGGLAMLLPDSTSREMMFKVTPPQADLDHMLQTLHEETDTDIRWTLLRFLCEWMDETPLIVQALLSSNESSHLATLAVDPKASSFTHLLLGLAMEHMGDEESLCGGWTRAGILLILQQVGISKYTKSLEGLKKQKEFPWAACDLEFQYWTTWCTKAVWTVRKRVVKELTGGNSAGDNSDEEHTDETVGESSAAPPSSGSLKPLQKLIAQQAKELDDLKKDLAKAQSKVTSQEQQLDTWKRRMESNPTELDSMLNDFTSKNASLEENIQVLEKELVQAKAQHEGELSQKDQVIAEQRQEVEHARTEEREAREDRDRMEQELQGVSQAYASLEEDYQRQQQPSHQATAGMPTGEPAQNQPEGEVSQQAPPSSTGSTEVSTLRAENNRLRTDARAADEWMSMAVQRMNDMGAQNGALQQQVASLQQQLQTVSTSAGGATAELQQQLQAASQHQEQLIEQLQTAAEQEEELRVALANQATQLQQEQSTIEQMHVDLTNQAAHLQQEKTMRESAEEQLGNADRELQQQLEEEREQRRHLQGQLASSQEDVRVAMESLGKAKDGREQMERQMANLSEELDRVRQGGPTSDASSELSERLAQLQAQYDTMLTSKQGELRALAEQLEQARLATAVPPAESTPESSERFIQLRADYDSMVASKEAEIQALCEQLEQARLAAPTQATAEVASLPVLEAQPTSDDHLKANIESVTQQLDAVHKELGRSHETLYQKESIIRELEERLNGGLGAYKLDDIRIRDEEISELRAANETAQDWMAKAVEHHALLSTKIASLSEQKASLTAQLNQVKGLVSPSDANAAVVKLLEHELSEKSNEIDQLRAELGQRQEEITAVREEINAKQATKYELEIARDEIASLRQQREQAYESKEELESRVDASATEISSLKEEIDRLGSQVTSDVPRPLPGGVTAPHIDAQALRSENERLKDSTLDLQKRLDEFQDWADMAQGRIAEILARKEHAEKLMQQANEALDRGQQESENLKTELADMTALVDDEKEANMALLNQRDVMIDKIEEFEAEKSSWQSGPSDTPEVEKSSGVSESSKDRHEKNISELERANEALAIELENHKTEMQDLKGKYDGMQTRFESGLQRIAEVVAEKKQLETNLSQEKDSINVARKELDLLRSELEVMTADLAVETEKRSLLLKERDDLMTKIEEAQESECNPVEIAESTVAQRIADLEELLRKKDVVIQDAQETLVKDGEVVDQWEETVAALECTVKDLEAQLQEQAQEANSAITRWQDVCSASEERCSELQKELELMTAKGQTLSESVDSEGSDNEDIVGNGPASEEKDSTMDDKIGLLESELKSKIAPFENDLQAANDAISPEVSTLEESDNLLAHARQTEDELRQAKESLGRSEAIVHKLEERIVELESTTKDLEVQLQEQDEESSKVITQWQEASSSAEGKCTERERELASVTAEKESISKALDTIEQDNEELEESKVLLEEKTTSMENDFAEQLREKEEALREAQETLARDVDVVNQWEERVAELETVVKDVEKQLEDQEQEANNAITGWQESYAESDSKCTKLEKELETVREEKDSLATASETIEEDNNELEKEKFALEERVSSLENSIARENVPIEPQYKEREVLEVQLREKEEALHEAQETLQRDADIVNQWEERGAELELAAKELKAQLEQQVEEANDAIFRWEETYTELEGKYSQLEQDLTKAGSADGKEVELLKQVERLSEKLKEAEQQASRAEEERQSMSKSWSTSEITIQMLQDDIESREESIKRLNAEVENVKSKRDESIERLNAEIDVARSELEKNLRSTTAEYTGIQTDLEKSKAEFVTVTDLIETERNSHLFEKEQLTGELDDEKARYTDARDEVANLTKKMEEIISENFVVSRQSLSERDEAIERLNAEIDIARSELEKLRSTNAKYTGIQADLEKSKAEVVAITDLLETERNSHLFEKEQLASELDDEKARYTEARDEVANLTKEVEEIRIESEDIVNQWTERANVQDTTIKELEDQLAQQEREANTAIQVWESKASELEKELEVALIQLKEVRAALNLNEHEPLTWTLETLMNEREANVGTVLSERDESIERLNAEIDIARSELEKLRSTNAKYTGIQADLEKSKAEVVAITDLLETERNSHLFEKEQLASELDDEKARYTEARDEVANLTKEVEEIRIESEDIVNQWTERADEQATTIKELEDQLAQQEREANTAIQVWESKASELEKELEVALIQLKEVRAALNLNEHEPLAWTLETLMNEREKAMEDRGALHAEVEDQKDSMDKLEAQFIDLEEKLEQQRGTIDQLELDRSLAKESRDKLDSEISRLADRCNELAESEQGAQKELGELTESHETLVRSLRAEEAVLIKNLVDIEAKLATTTKDRDRLAFESKPGEKLEEDRNRLAVVIGQLEEELREANDMVQAYVTDEASEKATESAALALRIEIEELQTKVDEHRLNLESESEAREMAEREVERLRDDLATLVSVSNPEDPTSDIHLFSAKAADKVKKRERAEIDQLRKTLFRALDELDIARTVEREASEKLSKTRLQASVCEQEIIASKSEVNFLAHTMEEMREAEESRRASLEYRISSLENDYEVLRRYHSGEIENLQNEVAQVTMEKDRILHTLKESEKANSALVFATSKGESESENDGSDPRAELAKLRVENAHLLTIASDEKARAVRKLREVRAAQAASAEADVILERELRISAEAAVKTMKVELEERSNDGNDDDGRRDKEGRNQTQNSLDALTSEVDRLKNDLQKIKQENTNLKSKLEDSTTKAKSQIDAMTEECRKAQAKAHKLEREGTFTAAVKSEVVRLRMSPGRSTQDKRDAGHEDWMLVSNDPGTDQTSLVGAGAYDYIQKQKEAILEERQMYVELLTEHDDLLALLAQYDHQRVCLREALAKAVGHEAVDVAIQEAEEKSRSQYGQVLRMS